ncbi:MAG TPA: hypothetical protein VFQ53_25165 [Kofleriaceae bacterium]|nr:hypothetical protein [Kofleriaceae bacterium]
MTDADAVIVSSPASPRIATARPAAGATSTAEPAAVVRRPGRVREHGHRVRARRAVHGHRAAGDGQAIEGGLAVGHAHRGAEPIRDHRGAVPGHIDRGRAVEHDRVRLGIADAIARREVDRHRGRRRARERVHRQPIGAAARADVDALERREIEADRADVAGQHEVAAGRVQIERLADVRAGEHERVTAEAAIDHVARVAGIPRRDVVAVAELHGVRAEPALDAIGARATDQQVGAGTTGDLVGTLAAIDRERCEHRARRHDRVVTGEPAQRHRDRRRGRDERVIAAAVVQHGGAIGEREHRVRSRRSVDVHAIARVAVDDEPVERGLAVRHAYLGRPTGRDECHAIESDVEGVRCRRAGDRDRVDLTVGSAERRRDIDVDLGDRGRGEIADRDAIAAARGRDRDPIDRVQIEDDRGDVARQPHVIADRSERDLLVRASHPHVERVEAVVALDHVATAARHPHDGVVAGTGHDRVVAEPAVEDVVAGASDERLDADPADERVVACPALERDLLLIGERPDRLVDAQHVVASATVDDDPLESRAIELEVRAAIVTDVDDERARRRAEPQRERRVGGVADHRQHAALDLDLVTRGELGVRLGLVLVGLGLGRTRHCECRDREDRQHAPHLEPGSVHDTLLRESGG